MKFTRTRFLTLLCAVVLALPLITACGGKKTDMDKALEKRLDQLDNSLDQLERETEIQKERVKTAKKDAQRVRQIFERGGKPADYMFDAASTAALTSASPKDSDSSETVTENDREGAVDGFFRTLVILLFALFAGVYIIKLYRDRANAPGNRQEPMPKQYETTSAPLDSDAPKAGIDPEEGH